MCGIVGFVGEEPAAPILLSGLEKLEYRGYDSAGIAVRNEETGRIEVVKAKGRLKILAEKTDGGMAVPGIVKVNFAPMIRLPVSASTLVSSRPGFWSLRMVTVVTSLTIFTVCGVLLRT